jgi:hypothetical protein
MATLKKEQASFPAIAFTESIESQDPETIAKAYLKQALGSDSAPGFTAPVVDKVESEFKSVGTESLPLTGTTAVRSAIDPPKLEETIHKKLKHVSELPETVGGTLRNDMIVTRAQFVEEINRYMKQDELEKFILTHELVKDGEVYNGPRKLDHEIC